MVKAKRWCWRRLMSWPDTGAFDAGAAPARCALYAPSIRDGTALAADRDHRPSAGFSLCRKSISTISDGQIRQGLSAMVQLLEHYFAEQSSAQTRHRLMRRRSHDEQLALSGYYQPDDRQARRAQPSGDPAGLFATLLQARTVRLDRDARPLLLIEDPETRLHPIFHAFARHLLNLLPLQRVTTTNSELLSLTPVEQVCRLVRGRRGYRRGGWGRAE